jgi:hypothetical protein
VCHGWEKVAANAGSAAITVRTSATMPDLPDMTTMEVMLSTLWRKQTTAYRYQSNTMMYMLHLC